MMIAFGVQTYSKKKLVATFPWRHVVAVGIAVCMVTGTGLASFPATLVPFPCHHAETIIDKTKPALLARADPFSNFGTLLPTFRNSLFALRKLSTQPLQSDSALAFAVLSIDC
jgi:hypothetical protein